MSLTRSMLKGMGLTDEQVSAIIEEHVATVDGLKADRDQYKADAEKLPKVQKELDDLKSGGEDWKTKYETEHKAFEDYKEEVTTKETTASIKSAYKALLVQNNVGEKHIDAIMRVTDFSTMKLGKDGKLSNEDKLVDGIKEEWSGFITSTEEKGQSVSTPPKNDGGSKTKEEIMSIKNASERQAAIAENHELFGF